MIIPFLSILCGADIIRPKRVTFRNNNNKSISQSNGYVNKALAVGAGVPDRPCLTQQTT